MSTSLSIIIDALCKEETRTEFVQQLLYEVK